MVHERDESRGSERGKVEREEKGLTRESYDVKG